LLAVKLSQSERWDPRKGKKNGRVGRSSRKVGEKGDPDEQDPPRIIMSGCSDVPFKGRMTYGTEIGKGWAFCFSR